MPRFPGSLKAWLVFVHRWLGILCCLPFILWFASGFVMMYHTFPSVSEADLLNRAAPLQIQAIRLTPKQAYDRLQLLLPPQSVRIVTVAGRPAYRFAVRRGESIVYADDGAIQDKSSNDFTRRLAADWTGQLSAGAQAEQLVDRDQWTVSGEFEPLQPIWKFTWPDGEQVYVSTAIGDVVQYTTRSSRVGAYLGAIPHWLYFAPLRKHGHTWSKIVIWLSGFSAFTAFVGIIIGLIVYSPAKRYQHLGAASAIPYAGTKRLHMILGLSVGVFACTWAFSGLLSMDPFPKLQGTIDNSGDEIEEALRGSSVMLSAFDQRAPEDALQPVASDFQVRELDLISFVGEPVYLAKNATGDVRVLGLDGKVAREFDFHRIVGAVQSVSQPARVVEARLITKYDAYYVDRHGRLPLPAIYIRLDDAESSAYYIDPKSAHVIEAYDSRSRWNRWLYHGLHSIDIPWLYAHRPVWDAVVLVLLAGGLGLILTAVWLAIRTIQRALPLHR